MMIFFVEVLKTGASPTFIALVSLHGGTVTITSHTSCEYQIHIYPEV